MSVLAYDSPSLARQRRRPRPIAPWLAVAVAVIALLTFCRVLGNDFLLWDDLHTIVENRDFNPPAPSQWGHYWTGSYLSLYMPLTYTLWGLLSLVAHTPAAAGGPGVLSPAIFHGVQLLAHMTTAVLVFFLLRRLVAGEWPAFFGAVIFAVHPLQLEPVAWITPMSIPISGALSVWAMLEFLSFSDGKFGRAHRIAEANDAAAPPVTSHPWLHYVLGSLALALALLFKPSAVVVPALVLTVEVILRRRPWKKLLIPLGIWCLLCVPLAVITHNVQRTPFTFPLWQRPIIAADAVAFYLSRLFFPLHLMPIYGRTPAWIFAHPEIYGLTWIAPVALLVVSIMLWRRARWVMAAAGLFVLSLAPVLGFNVFAFQKFSTVADRYTYLGMLGPALVIACLLALKPGRAAMSIVCVVAILLAGQSFRLSAYWYDALKLFNRELVYHPDSRQAHELVGQALNKLSHELDAAGDREGGREKLELAAGHYLTAAHLPDDLGFSYFNAGDCLSRLNRQREAIECFNAALRDPGFKLRGRAYDVMGLSYYRMGDMTNAEACFRKALAESQGDDVALDHKQAGDHLDNIIKRRVFKEARPASGPAATRPGK